MSSDSDDVLSLSDSIGSFSGFEPEDLEVGANETVVATTACPQKQSKQKLKSVVVKPKVNSAKSAKAAKSKTPAVTATTSTVPAAQPQKANTGNRKKKLECKKPSKSGSNLFDLDNLTPDSIAALRSALGLENTNNTATASVVHETPQPNIRVEVDNEGHGDEIELSYDYDSFDERGFEYRSPLESVGRIYDGSRENDNVQGNIEKALFDGESLGPDADRSTTNNGDELEWDVPKLKAPQLGDEISPSLARLITTACTSQCVTDEIVTQYKVPKNCVQMGAPDINPEVFEELDSKVRSYDSNFKDIQGLVATAMMPVVKLASILKGQIGQNPEAKKCISDCITLLGQVQFNLSLRRRYMIRPHLKKRYSRLCNIKTPITDQLFGNDIAGEMKKCETSVRLHEYTNPRPYMGRGTAYRSRRRRPFRGPYLGRGRRHHPYQSQYGQQPSRPGARSSTATKPSAD